MEQNARTAWKTATARLRKLLNEDTYDRWIAGIVPLAIRKNTFLLGVSNEIFSEWLANNYLDLIRTALEEATGKSYTVQFESGHEPPADETRREPAPVAGKRQSAVQETGTSQSQYDRRLTFDSFVVGENNKFAYAASHAVADAPGKAYNPLFIHGATGLGKTHLLQAIAQETLRHRKRARIEYLTSEDFANLYIDALMNRQLPRFRRHYRSVDLLLIDDVHFFKGKEQFQEEFFHTFNALYNRHKQIVLTSDRPPHEIGGLEKRLVSRFEWGLTSETLPPDVETRVAFLRKKQETNSLKLPDDVLQFVAEQIKSNFRRLEGALLRLVSYASMTGSEVDTAQAEFLLRPIIEEEATSRVSVEKIQRTVAEHFDIRVADMLGKRRPQNIAFPRQVAMFLCRRLTDHSTTVIGEQFNRNHGTILHAVTSIEQRMKADPQFRHKIGFLERKLRGF